MSPLSQAVDEYLALRRGLGFSLRQPGAMLHQFAACLEREGAPYITRELALRWAQQPAHAQPAQWASRLSVVRRFAQFWSASDPRTEVPPLGVLPHRYGRKPPYIYTEGEIRRLIAVARQLPSATGLRPATYATLLGLLAVTGLRISEALALNRADVDWFEAVLTIRRTKFGKSRLVPVHPSTHRALRRYTRLRDRVYPKPTTESVFVSERGARLTAWTVRYTFNRLSRRIGLRGPADRRGPRLHDLRHRLAVATPLVLEFLEHLQKERHNSARTRNARLAAIRSFMRFVEYRVPSALDQIRRVRAIPAQRTDTRIVRHLTADEQHALLDAPEPSTRNAPGGPHKRQSCSRRGRSAAGTATLAWRSKPARCACRGA